MKVKVHLPSGYGRFVEDYKGTGPLKAAPMFHISGVSDSGNSIPELNRSVRFGPEFYNLMHRVVPGIAARLGEDYSYIGDVESRKHRAPDVKYAYYGFGPTPLMPNSELPFVHLYGYGNKPIDSGMGFVYSQELDAPSVHGGKDKSEILTNILNDSEDFSQLFGNRLAFKDPDYPWDQDPEGKQLLSFKNGKWYGPRFTDVWIPRLDENGRVKRKEDGTMDVMPVPRVASLPIYNFRHPMWLDDPEKAWTMLDDPKALRDWRSWGVAPTYADYTGKVSRTKKGDIRPMDYMLNNLKLADKGGYFLDFVEEHGGPKAVHDMFREYTSDAKIAKRLAAIEEEADKMEADMTPEDKKRALESQAAWANKNKGGNSIVIKSNDTYKLKTQAERNLDRKNFIKNMFSTKDFNKENLDELTNMGLAYEPDKALMTKHVSQSMWDDMVSQGLSPSERRRKILDSYIDSRNTQKNITDALIDKF